MIFKSHIGLIHHRPYDRVHEHTAPSPSSIWEHVTHSRSTTYLTDDLVQALLEDAAVSHESLAKLQRQKMQHRSTDILLIVPPGSKHHLTQAQLSPLSIITSITSPYFVSSPLLSPAPLSNSLLAQRPHRRPSRFFDPAQTL